MTGGTSGAVWCATAATLRYRTAAGRVTVVTGLRR